MDQRSSHALVLVSPLNPNLMECPIHLTFFRPDCQPASITVECGETRSANETNGKKPICRLLDNHPVEDPLAIPVNATYFGKQPPQIVPIHLDPFSVHRSPLLANHPG